MGDYVVLGCEMIFVLFFIYYAIEEFLEVIKKLSKIVIDKFIRIIIETLFRSKSTSWHILKWVYGVL